LQPSADAANPVEKRKRSKAAIQKQIQKRSVLLQQALLQYAYDWAREQWPDGDPLAAAGVWTDHVLFEELPLPCFELPEMPKQHKVIPEQV